MKDIVLKKGKVQHHQSRDVYSQKSYIEHIPLENILIKIIVVTSYEYITETLGIKPNDIEKIENWVDEQTEKLFEDYKSNSTKFTGHTIIKEFFTEPFLDVDYFIENEA
jgi:hypothetical protein